MINDILQIFLHLDESLLAITSAYGYLIYILIFIIIFAETGLVIMPFLPGDSLLFAAGALASLGSLNLTALLVIITIAAILGDTINYTIGHFFGPKIFRKETGLFFNKKYLLKTEKFYEKNGPKTIILARFIPIIRTFAPFVAGIGNMNYPKFLTYNIIGGIAWVFIFIIAGYLFGNIPAVKENFSFVILAIIIISIIPIILELIRRKEDN